MEAAAIYLLISLVFCITLKTMFREEKFVKIFLYYLCFGIPVALTGHVSGFVSGISRIAVVGTVLPAVLALIGGINIYVFGTDNKYKIVIGYCISVFMLMLYFGIESGAYQREASRESYLRYLSEQEFRLRSFRNDLNLPQDIPSWMNEQAGNK
jgi:hypothetical protein